MVGCILNFNAFNSQRRIGELIQNRDFESIREIMENLRVSILHGLTSKNHFLKIENPLKINVARKTHLCTLIQAKHENQIQILKHQFHWQIFIKKLKSIFLV